MTHQNSPSNEADPQIDGQPQGKYSPKSLLPALRIFIDARNAAIKLGFTDNGGAIHSVERILDILCQRVKYPDLRHINDLKRDPTAERSVGAHQAILNGDAVLIEHVMPKREFARHVIAIVESGASDNDIIQYVGETYRLVLLSREETIALNRMNRSRMTSDRIEDAGIKVFGGGSELS